MATVDEVREDLLLLLDRSLGWLNSLPGISGLPVDEAEIGEQVRDLRGKRGRARSSLLNVGLLGRQSSGKSFLISGLQKGLRYERFEQPDGGFTQQYIGILPSSPTPTTACPSTVTPVHPDAEVRAPGRGLLRVKFAGHPADWVEIGTDLAPGVVAAYGATDGDRANRFPDHYHLDVVHLELLIENASLPAKFFDLPGAESPDPAYEDIMYEAWKDADCFLYVTQGTATLTANELGLITDLYNHHLQTGKPVLWVLTGIDRADQLGNDNRPAWQSAQETNNSYLRERFRDPGGAGASFVGEGFIGVSPAWEAQADLDEAEGNARAAQRGRVSSRMQGLRRRLTEMIESGTGQFHLGKIADEAHRLVDRRHRMVADVLAAHQVSVEQLTGERDDLRRRLAETEESAERVRGELAAELDRRVRDTERRFGELAEVFHRELDAVIDAGDLGLEHRADIRLRQTRLFTEWMTAEQGPAVLWAGHVESLDARARALLCSELSGEEHTSQLVQAAPLNPGELFPVLDDRRRLDVYGMVQAAGAAVTVASALGGVVTSVLASLSLTALTVTTGGLAAAGVAAVAGAQVLKARRSVLEQARDDRRNRLTEEAQRARGDFATVARHQGQQLADAVADHVTEYRDRLRAALRQIEERIDAPDMATSRDLVAELEPVHREGQAVLDGLAGLARLASAPR
ncbi:hypothetical protein [Streptomyces sp. NPDC057877]|uniref:hypothetical protein n=1 Tax=Streptomyces sp. NPDC057877 TaxID=3346269 RepID=UPI00369CBB2E